MTKLKLPVYVSTNDKHVECLKVFIELYQKFWKDQEFNVLGYTPVDVGEMGTFHSMGKQGPVQEWSTDLRNFFKTIEEDFFIYCTEDIAFVDHTDIGLLNQLTEIIQNDPTIGRINLVDPCQPSNNGQGGYTIDNNPHYKANPVKSYGDGKLYKLTKKTNYAITAQASIWNKKFFLNYCQPGLSPWDFELDGSRRWVEDTDFSVLLFYSDKYPLSKVESYAGTRGWENKEAWIEFVSPSLRKEIN